MTHTTVVAAVVTSALLAKSTNPEPESGVTQRRITVTTSAVAIAEISLQALIRHQYHRSRYTPPVPAPMVSTTCHPATIDPSCAETYADTTTSSKVARRDTVT